jgi:hypothetical protein
LAFERFLDRGNALVANPFDDHLMKVGKLSVGDMDPLLHRVDIERFVYGAIEHRFHLLTGVVRREVFQLSGRGRLLGLARPRGVAVLISSSLKGSLPSLRHS